MSSSLASKDEVLRARATSVWTITSAPAIGATPPRSLAPEAVGYPPARRLHQLAYRLSAGEHEELL